MYLGFRSIAAHAYDRVNWNRILIFEQSICRVESVLEGVSIVAWIDEVGGATSNRSCIEDRGKKEIRRRRSEKVGTSRRVVAR